MKTSIIVFLALLITSQALQVKMMSQFPQTFSNKRNVMTLFTQIESALKSGGPLDAITKTLKDFKVSIIQEQLNHDALYQKQTQECQVEFQFRQKEVTDAQSALNEATQTLNSCTEQQTRASSDLVITKEYLARNQEHLQIITDRRNVEAEIYAAKKSKNEAAQVAITEAIAILDEIWNGQSGFVELARHSTKMLQLSVSIGKTHLFAPAMSALAQLATSQLQASEETLQRIHNLLIQLGENLQHAFDLATENEQAAIQEFSDDKARTETSISNLQHQQAGLETELDQLHTCIVTQSAIQQSASTKRDRNQKIWDTAVSLCHDFDQEYVASKQSRDEELTLLAQITSLVEKRFSELKSDVAYRGTQDTFDAHQNESEFEHQDNSYSSTIGV